MSTRIDALHPPKTYLYNAGDECLELTGGWISYGTVDASGYVLGNFSKNNGCLSLYANSKGVSISVGTTRKIDLTEYKQMIIEYTYINQASIIICDNPKNPRDNQITGGEIHGKQADITHIVGLYYICIATSVGVADNPPANMTLAKIYLTK